MFNVSNDILYIGADDTDLDLFEGQYRAPFGVSYNSYVCKDKKIAVFDTADERKRGEWLENLDCALNGEKPDYLIISHVEPDHAASIPAFLERYPDATVVGNERTFLMIKRFHGDLKMKELAVKDGDELTLGEHTLKFLLTPFVHWPEVMMCYDKKDKVFFSADAFGKFGALSHEEDWLDEARRYYINIVGKYGNSVQAALKKAAALDIKTICPLHGPVLSSNLEYYLNKYDLWSSYRPEKEGVYIAYASVYGNTAAAAKKLKDELTARGVEAECDDLCRTEIAEAVSKAFEYSKLVIASVTLDAGVMPCVESFINKLKAKNYSNRRVGFIQNGSWSPVSARYMRALMENLKGIEFCENTVTLNSSADGETYARISALADELKS